MEEEKKLSRSEREASIKDKAGWTITVIAALLAINTYIASGLSSSVLTNTIKANDTWNFYQAKSIKQSYNDQTWRHLVCTFDGKINKLYIDGTLLASDTSDISDIYYQTR